MILSICKRLIYKKERSNNQLYLLLLPVCLFFPIPRTPVPRGGSPRFTGPQYRCSTQHLPDNVEQTRLPGEVVVDQVDKIVAVVYVLYDLAGLGFLLVQLPPLFPPQAERFVLTHGTTEIGALSRQEHEARIDQRVLYHKINRKEIYLS